MATKDPIKRAAHNRAYYLKNKDLYRSRADAMKARNREFVRIAKANPCTDCGVEYPTPCMEFDHVSGEKIGNISEMMLTSSIARLEAEIAKCELVCANCHRLRTWQRAGRPVE